MPFFTPSVSFDPEICKQHLPSDAQNLIGQLLFCSPYQGFTVGPGGDNPQPNLVWDPTSDCPIGSGFPPCRSYQSWLTKAEQEDGDLRFIVRDTSTAGAYAWQIDAGEMRNWAIKPRDCIGARLFQVAMYYVDSDEFLMGPDSIFYSIECPRSVPWVIPLEVPFESISFHNLDDGESDIPQDVEVYGFMLASTTLENHYLNLARWDQQASNYPDEAFHAVLDTTGTKGAGCPPTQHRIGVLSLHRRIYGLCGRQKDRHPAGSRMRR